MESKAALERSHVEIASFASVVRRMDAYTEVSTKDEHIHIEAQTKTCADCNVFQKIAVGDAPSRTAVITLQQPNIAGIKESCAMQIAKNRETIFAIGFKAESTRLIIVGIGIITGRMITARPYRTHRKSSDGVGTANVELLSVRHLR